MTEILSGKQNLKSIVKIFKTSPKDSLNHSSLGIFGQSLPILALTSSRLSHLNLTESIFCRAWFFCKSCHDDVKDENLIKKCKCKNCKFSKSSLLQVFDSWIELRTKSFSASFSCYSVPYNSEITLKILFAPLVAKFRTGVRAIQLVGRASESAPNLF